MPDADPTRLVTLVDVVPSALVTWKVRAIDCPHGGRDPP